MYETEWREHGENTDSKKGTNTGKYYFRGRERLNVTSEITSNRHEKDLW
jgi:hypothetical protein